MSIELRVKEHQQWKGTSEEWFPAQLEIFHSDGMRKSADRLAHGKENWDDCVQM
jgi:hypothetical protein